MNGRCQRCFKETSCTIMSMYNTQMICINCKDTEEQREDYQQACKAESDAVRSGNYNYQGIGLR